MTTMIWSGCSMTFGSGILCDKSQKKNDKPEWHHPKLKEMFSDIKTVGEAREVVKQISYPMQLGKRLGMDTYNLSVQGYGIESQFRTVSSFLINNKDKIDYTKTMFCYQIPELSRVELLMWGPGEKGWKRSDPIREPQRFVFNANELPKGFLTQHFNIDYYIAKYLMTMLEYKGFLESKGIKVFYFDHQNYLYPLKITKNYRKKSDKFMMKNMLYFNDWNHEPVGFPSKETILKELDIQELDMKNPNSLTGRDIAIETLYTGGFHEDGHYSPKGHTQLAEVYERFFLKIL
tara:strand:+ start:339 stop:1208 length:870 start_codon:yes stop_codon:yes gene_type:complete